MKTQTFETNAFTFECRQVRERDFVPEVCLWVSGVDVDSITNFAYSSSQHRTVGSDNVLLMITAAS